jgi:fructose-1,6-bisphosphatase/inositol monophosphatase family enzyme
MPKIIYKNELADYPRGRYEGAISVTKVRNAMKKRGYELVNAKNSRRNNVLEGSFGFIKDPATGKLVYFDADASACFNGDKVLYRTAKHEKDYTGGTNRYADFSELGQAVADLFAHPERWD